jgi:hypothetical protein
VERADFHLSVHQLLLFTLVGIGLKLAADYLAAGERQEFDEVGLAVVGAGYLVAFVACYLVDRMQRLRRVGLLFLVLLATGLFSQLVLPLAPDADRLDLDCLDDIFGWSVLLALALWNCMFIGRAVKLVYGSGWLRTVVATVLLIAVVAVPQYYLPEDTTWYAAPQPQPKRPRVNVESTYDKQWDLLEAKLDAMAPQRPGEAELYFVGFAGYGGQDVFMKEVRSAQALFDARFDTRGHSLALINNMSTVKDEPLASVTNLRDGLNWLGKHMDVEEDVLFLYLMSHGSPDASISVELANMQLNHLHADRLRRMLDSSRIKWRVVVVTACHAASFIDALRDERTLIVTASATDKKSWGFFDQADFTYFGEAFIERALRRHLSFVDAFEEAKRLVTEREWVMNLPLSEPQIYIGAEIGAKLGELERRLRARTPHAAL